MVPAPPKPLLLLAETGWFGSAAALLGVGVIAYLIRELWRTRRNYALDLAEQAHVISHERERAAQAVEAKEAVIRESRAKNEMLATLSREIRAHLNGVVGSADLLLDQSLTPQQREHVSTLRSSAESLLQSMNDVLDYSSLEAGQIEIIRAAFDLRQPFIEVVDLLTPRAALGGLELVLILAPDVPLRVSGDAARLRQVLFNITSHALKVTSTGRIVLRVELNSGSTAASKQGATWVHVSVSGTGTGRSSEGKNGPFEPDSSSLAGGGSGLELAVSKRLVELMGGQIGTREAADGGAEFWLLIPLIADQVQPSLNLALPDGLHVVVLEDAAAARIAASSLLTRMGVDHDVSDTLARAVEALHDARQGGATRTALLVDESVLEAGGASLARVLAEHPVLQSTPIIVLTRNPDTSVEAGRFASETLRKPLIRVEALAAVLRKSAGETIARQVDSRAPFESKRTQGPDAPRVLVVDDDAVSRMVTSLLLEHLGCTVAVAKSGPESIELAEHTNYSLILMDCQMPGMDGYTTTERIRAAKPGATPPIVAVTANTAPRDRERCFAVGMCDFVGKPVSKNELDRVVKRWTGAQPSAYPRSES